MGRVSAPKKPKKPTTPAGTPEPAPFVLSRTFPPGTIARPNVPDPAPQVIRPVRCPYCGSDNVRRTSAWGRMRYYECRRCADPETCAWTRFKVVSAS